MRKRAAGFTLLELLIATGLLGVVVGSSLLMMLQGNGAYRRTSQLMDCQGKARRALTRVVEELQRAGGDLTPDLTGTGGSDTVTFVTITGIFNGNPVWSDPLRIAREPAPEDPDDGADNDGDGIVDEGELVLTRNVGMLNQTRTVLCTNVRERAENETVNGVDDNANGVVDEAGFNVQRTTDLLTVRICVEEPGDGGRTTLATLVTAFNLRN